MISCSLPRIALRGAGPVVVALLALLAAAPAALATNMRYEVPTSPAYSQESEDETRTIDYGGCLTAGEPQTVQVRVTSSIFSEASGATFQVSSEDGAAPAVTVSPATVQIEAESVQTFDVALTFTLPGPTTEETTFRVRLVPDSGEEVRDGSGGLRVRVACATAPTVSAIPAPATSAVPTAAQNCVGRLVRNESQRPATGKPGSEAEVLAGVGRDCAGTLRQTAPGQFPAAGSRQARRCAPLRVRSPLLRAGERATIRVTLPDLPGAAEVGSVVRLTGPGVTVKGVTAEGGVVSLRVRPRRSGVVVVQSDRLLGSRRIRVLPRRSAAAQGQPRFTG